MTPPTTPPTTPPLGGGLIETQSMRDWKPSPEVAEAIRETCGMLAADVEKTAQESFSGRRNVQ